MVKFVASKITPFLGCTVISVNPRVANIWRTYVVSLDGGFSKRALEGCKRLVSASNLHGYIYIFSCEIISMNWLTLVLYAGDKEQDRTIVGRKVKKLKI